MADIILASQSPRRQEIFSYFTLPFRQIPSQFDEESVVYQGDPFAYATQIAKGKAEVVSLKHPQAIIIGADTIVLLENRLYGKPSSYEEAVSFLMDLNGKWHSVITAVIVKQGRQLFSAAEQTRVLFHPFTEVQINHYLSQIRWSDKAGGYTVQGYGGIIVRKIEGCYHNVLGLPLNALGELLSKCQIDLWTYLK